MAVFDSIASTFSLCILLSLAESITLRFFPFGLYGRKVELGAFNNSIDEPLLSLFGSGSLGRLVKLPDSEVEG